MSSDTSPAANASDPAPGWKRPFFTLWIGQSIHCSEAGSFSSPWCGGSPSPRIRRPCWTTAVLVAILPSVFLAPVAGVLVDRLNRRLVMIGLRRAGGAR